MKKSLLLIIYIYFLKSFCFCLLEENNNTITIKIDSFFRGDEIGKKGILAFEIDYDAEKSLFDQLDIEENTKFIAIITNEKYENNTIDCNLFQFQLEQNLKVFWYFNETTPKGSYSIYFNLINLNYKEYKINIDSTNDLSFKKSDLNTVVLYSDKQVYVFEENTYFIELQFKINTYNNERLFLWSKASYVKLDFCKVEKNKLKCQIPKIKLEGIMIRNENDFSLVYLEDDNNLYENKLIGKIIIKK